MKETFAQQDAQWAAPFLPGNVNVNTMNLDRHSVFRWLDHCAAKSFLATAYCRFARCFHRSSERKARVRQSDLL